MKKTIFKALFHRIHVSQYLSRLENANESYLNGDKSEYLAKMDHLHSDLQILPLVFHQPPSNSAPASDKFPINPPVADNTVAAIYQTHNDLFTTLQQLIRNGHADELYNFSPRITQFIDTLYESLFNDQNRTQRIRRVISRTGLITIVALGIISIWPLKERYFEEQQQYNIVVNEEAYKQQTIEDMLKLRDALQKYYGVHNSYPKSSGGFDAVIAVFGESREQWIPGLAPDFVSKLPVDPRRSKNPREQYMYKSDGKDYKLIAHNPLGMNDAVSKHPGLIDPARPSWAIGSWSEGAKSW